MERLKTTLDSFADCQPMHRKWLAASLLFLCCCISAQAQVIVHTSKGTKERGERIVPLGDDAYRLEIYRGFSQTIPKAAAQKIEETPEPRGGPLRAIVRAPKDRLSTDEKAILDRWIVSYFDSADEPEKQAEVLTALREHDALPADEVASITKRIRELAQNGPKLVLGTSKFAHPRFPGEVNVEIVPKGQPPGKELPIFLALHGGGENDGHWGSGTGMFVAPAKASWKQGVFIRPSVLHKKYAEWGKNPVEEEYVRELLKAAKRTWDIDTNRVYIGGHSMGGYGTWHIGGHQADVFAGMVSAAGGILTGRSLGESWGWGVIGNLRHTRIAFLHGTKDGPSPVWSDQEANRILNELEKQHPGQYVHRYLETVGGGHMPPGGQLNEQVKWILQHERNPSPKELTWEPTRTFLKQFYWLRVEKPAMFQRIEASIKGNTIELTTTRLNAGFSVMLNDHLVDLSKPVTVRVNGEEAFHGSLQPSVTAILESIADKLDDKLVYTTRIDF